MTPAVVVVGDVATDVVVVLAGEPAPGSDRPAAISTRGGGAAANVAAHLARLGVSVELAGCVGDDPPAAGLAAELTAAGVRLALRTVPGVPTGTIVSLVEPGGLRHQRRQARHALVVVGRTAVDELAGLGAQRLHDHRVAMTQAVDRPALDEVEILAPLAVAQPGTGALHHDDGRARGDLHEVADVVVHAPWWRAGRRTANQTS